MDGTRQQSSENTATQQMPRGEREKLGVHTAYGIINLHQNSCDGGAGHSVVIACHSLSFTCIRLSVGAGSGFYQCTAVTNGSHVCDRNQGMKRALVLSPDFQTQGTWDIKPKLF